LLIYSCPWPARGQWKVVFYSKFPYVNSPPTEDCLLCQFSWTPTSHNPWPVRGSPLNLNKFACSGTETHFFFISVLPLYHFSHSSLRKQVDVIGMNRWLRPETELLLVFSLSLSHSLSLTIFPHTDASEFFTKTDESADRSSDTTGIPDPFREIIERWHTLSIAWTVKC